MLGPKLAQPPALDRPTCVWLFSLGCVFGPGVWAVCAWAGCGLGVSGLGAVWRLSVAGSVLATQNPSSFGIFFFFCPGGLAVTPTRKGGHLVAFPL